LVWEKRNLRKAEDGQIYFKAWTLKGTGPEEKQKMQFASSRKLGKRKSPDCDKIEGIRLNRVRVGFVNLIC